MVLRMSDASSDLLKGEWVKDVIIDGVTVVFVFQRPMCLLSSLMKAKPLLFQRKGFPERY